MRARLESLFLVLALGAAAAFIYSFATGWKPGGNGNAQHEVRSRADAHIPLDSVHVEVLNASGREGLARLVTERLRAAGFDVVYFGNSAAQREEAVVFDRVGRPAYAQAVAGALGIPDVRTELDSSRVVEVSVVLGRAWTGAP